MTGSVAAEDPAVLAACARLSAEIETIEAMYLRHVEWHLPYAGGDDPIPFVDAWLIRTQLTSGLRAITACVDDLMLLQGARAIGLASPVTRAWLDLSAARAHIGNDPSQSLGMAGAALMQE